MLETTTIRSARPAHLPQIAAASGMRLLCAVVLLTACRAPNIEDYRAGGSQITTRGGITAMTSQAEVPLVTVNGHTIFLAEYERRFNALSGLSRARLNGTANRFQFLENLTLLHLMAQHAVQQGISNDAEVAFAESRALLDVVADRINADDLGDVTPEDIDTTYEAQAFRFHRPASVRLMLMLSDEESAQAVRRQLNLHRPDGVERQVAEFSEAVLQDGRALRDTGGDTGFVTVAYLESVFSPELYTEFENLERVGHFSQAVRVAGGYAVMLLLERRNAIQRDLEDVEQQLREDILNGRRLEARVAWSQQVRQDAPFSVDEAAIARLVESRLQPNRPSNLWVEAHWSPMELDQSLTPTVVLDDLAGLLAPPVALYQPQLVPTEGSGSGLAVDPELDSPVESDASTGDR